MPAPLAVIPALAALLAVAPSAPPPGTAAGSAPTDAPPTAPAGLAPAAARKDDETSRQVEQAKAYFASGNEHYAAGRYQEAIRDFQAGYALVPRPNFLVNLGQAYRKLGDLTRAKDAYLAYVRALPQDSPLRDQALQVLAEIEVQLQERRTQEPPPVEPGPGLAGAAGTGPAGAATGAGAPEPDTAAATSPSRAWGWVLGGTGLAAAGTGLFFQLRAKQAGDDLTRLTREGGFFDPALERRGRRDQRLGVGLMAGGAAALAGAAVLLWIMGDPPAASSAERASPPRPRTRRLTLRPAGPGFELRF